MISLLLPLAPQPPPCGPDPSGGHTTTGAGAFPCAAEPLATIPGCWVKEAAAVPPVCWCCLSLWAEETRQSSLAAAPGWMLLSELCPFVPAPWQPRAAAGAEEQDPLPFPKGSFLSARTWTWCLCLWARLLLILTPFPCFPFPWCLPASWMKAGPAQICTSRRLGSANRTTTPGRDLSAPWAMWGAQMRLFQGPANQTSKQKCSGLPWLDFST